MASIDLQGKVVVVTGAGSGLGRAMALGLADAGANVMALDIEVARAAITTQDAKKSGSRGTILPQACDVRRLEDCDRAIANTIEKLGGLTGLVNCAGLGMPHMHERYFDEPVQFWKADPQRWQDIVDTNIRGPFLLARAATPHMIAAKWGRIVNVTTSFNTMIRGANMPYGQTKAALEAASCSWASDLEGTGVTVNVLIPGGAADTRMIPQDSPYERAKLVKPEAMVAPIRWLMSDASGGVTGRRFIGRKWNPAAPWQDAMKVAGAGAAWPALAAEGSSGQPLPNSGSTS